MSSPATTGTIESLAINTIRILSADGVQNANSGHPGMPMGAAAMAYTLWTKFLKHNPKDPQWFDRDRFILSAGHGSMLLYSLLHLTGYDLGLDELKRFRQLESRTPGHPERGVTPGVEVATGPLGQGFSNGVGMAMAEQWLAKHFNRPGYELIDHYIYAICGDGDLMEGVTQEAASLAGHLGLGQIVYLYDQNHISLAGATSLIFTEDVGKRFDAYGWHTRHDSDGNNTSEIAEAIQEAREERHRPSLILVRTHIGFGSPNKQDTAEVHGSPLGEAEVRLTKKNLGWTAEETFHIPPEALSVFRECLPKGAKFEAAWQELRKKYSAAHPDKCREWELVMNGGLREGWETQIPNFTGETKPMATREASGKVLAALFPVAPGLIGGSADLAPSTNTYIKGFGDFEAGTYASRNFHFGIREHGMGAALNGMALHGGVIPYGATFLVFSDYMRPSIRLAAMMKLHVIYVWTHDSIGLGEDGPTHQPVEHLAALRAIPGLTVIRPCDAAETAEAWRVALRHANGPVALALTRQKLPIIDRARHASAAGLSRGAYILSEADGGKPEAIIISTGSEVNPALGARELLQSKGVETRVVSMPSWEIFEAQDTAYRESVIPSRAGLRVSVEAAVTFGWQRWVGENGMSIGLDRFGASAPFETLMKEFGFTAEGIADRILKRLK